MVDINVLSTTDEDEDEFNPIPEGERVIDDLSKSSWSDERDWGELKEFFGREFPNEQTEQIVVKSKGE